ncbi:hypothetical protein HQ585_01555 [candidate division KSB1 bacterium]|nr:hypothetical protein [candidate division KSB1 bacterium]
MNKLSKRTRWVLVVVGALLLLPMMGQQVREAQAVQPDQNVQLEVSQPQPVVDLGSKIVEKSLQQKQEAENRKMSKIQSQGMKGVTEIEFQIKDSDLSPGPIGRWDQLATGYETIVWDPEPNYFLPDGNYVWVTYPFSTAPAGAVVTNFEYRMWMGEEDVGGTDFWCLDYIIAFSNQTHGKVNTFYRAWNMDGGHTDLGEDDDVPDDYSIYLYRSTSVFNGNPVNQDWYAYVGDHASPDDGNINYIRMWIYWETADCGVAVTSPNGGETWEPGSTHNITWTSFGTTGTVGITYTYDAGLNWHTVTSSTSDDGSYMWTIPNTPGTQCAVIVDAWGGCQDMSNGYFTIGEPPEPCGDGTDSWVDADDFLHIPMTIAPPEIDGELDPEWYSTPVIKLLHNTANDPLTPFGTEPDDYLDATCAARAMWDADYFYFFAKVVDDMPGETDSPNAWENDCFEFYFDGDNSKDPGVAPLTGDDIQWRWIYGDATGNPSVGGEDIAWYDTYYGYNFEMRIPASDLTFPLLEGHDIGFEIHLSDRDFGNRQHKLTWWSTSDNAWQEPSIWGKAVLDPAQVSDILPCYSADTPPVIDGIQDEMWDNYPLFPTNCWIVEAVDFEAFDSFFCDSWIDFRMAWDADNFYGILYMRDEINANPTPDRWNNDSVEIYWDGDNADSNPYDANDTQVRFGSDGTVELGIGGYFGCDASINLGGDRTGSDGYWIEFSAPWSSLNFTGTNGNLFGLEIQANDNDNEGATNDRESQARWWSNNNDTWIDAGLFGTARFMGGDPVDCEIDAIVGCPEHCTGSQVEIPIDIDMSGASAPDNDLGSYTASLSWNTSRLSYVGYTGGTTTGWSAPTVNTSQVGSGQIGFGAANASGSTGLINILNLTFDVIGSEGQSGVENLEFSAMSAASTFTDLLPVLCIDDCSYTINSSCGILGDVNSDDVVNSTDALIILSCDVGLDVSSFCPMNCGDVNDDGIVNSTDALILMSYDVGVSVPFPIGDPGCPSSVIPCAGCTP